MEKIPIKRIGHPGDIKRIGGACPYCSFTASGHYLETVLSVIENHIKEEHPAVVKELINIKEKGGRK